MWTAGGNDHRGGVTCPACGNTTHRLITITWDAEGGHAKCWACKNQWDISDKA